MAINIDPELLRRVLRYEPDTGKLFWLRRTSDLFNSRAQTAQHNCNIWNGKFAGTEALTADNGMGYRIGQVFGRMMYAHRVAWAISFGETPPHEIDHINHNTSDNRLINLRAVDSLENNKNRPGSKRNKSGQCGVGWHKLANKWVAEIRANGKKHYLGLFIDKDDAIAARKAAENKFNFHPNHGKAAA